MDIVTQAVLGAAVGYAVLGRRIGSKAALFGAAAGVLPDMDIFFANAEDVAFWDIHRGISHALLFGPVLALLLAPLSRAIFSRLTWPVVPLLNWWLFWALTIGTHPVLDLMTTYGTQIFAPFDRTPYAFSAISIIDPTDTGLLIAGLLMVFVWRSDASRAHRFMLWMLAVSSAYVGVSGYQNTAALRQARAQLPENAQVFAYTTIFTPWLRRLVVDEPHRLRVGFTSTVNPQPIRWQDIPKDPEAVALAHAVRETLPGQTFFRFAQGPTHARLVHAASSEGVRRGRATCKRWHEPSLG